MIISGRQKSVRINDGPSNPLYGFSKKTGNSTWCGKLHKALDVSGILGAGVRIISAPGPPVRIGGNRMMDPKAVGLVIFPCAVGGETHGRGASPMVGIAQCNHVVIACIEAGHQESQIICL